MDSVPAQERLSFFGRLALAIRTFFSLLFSSDHAQRVLQLEAGAQEPSSARGTPPPPTPKPDTSGPDDAAALAPATKTEPTRAGLDPEVVGALRLLRLLQREGRFIDFVEQDITDFDDADVGAAARVVHSGCREALHQQMKVSPISTVAEDETSEISDTEALQSGRWKLTGKVSGTPPHRGVVRHCGWLAEDCHLPKGVAGDDAQILCPAELEAS